MTLLHLRCDRPAAAFRRLAGQPWAMLLDSAASAGGRGRYSYIVADPIGTVEAVDGQVFVDGLAVSGNPWDVLAAQHCRHRDGLPDQPFRSGEWFSGGAVGVLGYELGRHLERLPGRHPNPAGTPQMAMGFYDTVAVFDHHTGDAWVSAARREAWPRASRLAAALEASVAPPALPPDLPWGHGVGWRPELTVEDYCSRVGGVLDYIRAGDIYQANFTQRFLADLPAGCPPYALYERLRGLSPAPFAAFINAGPRLTVISASPERFLRLHADGRMEARPIKGTAPRFADAQADAASAKALMDSVKDRAENLMITDLLRNDLARVATIGSVRVPTLYGIESFANVHHLVSVVQAQLQAGRNVFDLLKSTFPGGSITGAPKIRAMEIIDELEVSRRGAYCGSVAWIGFDGAMDSSIIIRTLTLTGEGVIAQAGGGIVADSQPLAEHDEMMLKVRPLLQVLNGGLP